MAIGFLEVEIFWPLGFWTQGFFIFFVDFSGLFLFLPNTIIYSQKNFLAYDIDNMCIIIELTFLIKKNIFKVKILQFLFIFIFFFEMLPGTYFSKTL